MDRITKPHIEDGRTKLKDGNSLADAIDQLWFYENTGVEPDDITYLAVTFRMIAKSIKIADKIFADIGKED